MEAKLLSSIFNNEHIKFYYKNKLIKLGEYEELNLKVIDYIINNDKKLNTMMYAGNESMYIIFLIKIAIETYISNITNPNNNLLDNINIGDKVSVDGKIGEYIGIEDLGKYGEGMKVSFNKGDTSTILKKSLYKILPYCGDANISRMTTNISTKSFITKELIAYLLNNDNWKETIKQFTGIINQTNVVIIPNKQYIDNVIKEIIIEYKGKFIPFTEVFPCAYITSGQNIIDMPGNYAKQEPLLNFTSSIAVAYELVRYKKNIKNVFVLGSGCIDKEFIDLENIISRKSINKVNVLSDNSNILNMANIIEYTSINKKECNLFAWTKNALLNISLVEYLEEEIEVFESQQLLIDKYIDKTHIVELVDNHDDSSIIENIRRLMSKLLKTEMDKKYKNIFIINGYGLLNTLETTPFTIKILEENIDKLGIRMTLPKVSLDNLKNLKKELIADNVTEELINDIIKNIELVVNNMEIKNYKWDKLMGQLAKYRASKYYWKNNNDKVKVLIIVKKQYEAIILNKYLNDQNIRADVISIDKFDITDIYDEVFVLGLYNSNKNDLFNDAHLLNTKYLLYKSELNRYKYHENKNIYLNKLIENNNKIYDILEFELFENIENTTDSKTNIEQEQDIIDAYAIEEYIENNKFEIDFTKTSYYQNLDIKTTVNAEKIIISENNEYALLTKKYKAQYIDWENNKIVKTDINKIKEGDSLLFLNEYLDEESSIVINIIERLIKDNNLKIVSESEVSIKEKYELTKYWKSKLELYREKNNLTYKELADSMKVYGENVHYVTIANWINNVRIIGPRNKSTYIAIGKLIDDEYMQSNIDDFYQASKDIRKLHTKVKGYIDKIIVSEFFKKDIKKVDTITKVISEILGDTNQYVTTIQVNRISNYNKEIPQYLSNKLLDIENTY